MQAVPVAQGPRALQCRQPNHVIVIHDCTGKAAHDVLYPETTS
jgi:hypothetical protein